MKTIRKIYHIGMIAFPAIGILFLLGNIIRMIAGAYNMVYILCFAIMTLVAYHLMLIPAIRGLKKQKGGQ